jgi:demethylmenaquinone methyltransferase/2-methoxy-6-polyprenyl-1,4-benzoquinol methylase
MPYPKATSWQMFDRIASRYDFLNRVLSLGIDRSWRKRLVAEAPLAAQTIVDLATGTGDVLLTFERCYPGNPVLKGYDLSSGMVSEGVQKCQRLGSRVTLLMGDAANIPEPDAIADIVTMSFGIRNVPDVPQVLSEIHRLLKPEGTVLILEFTMPKFPVLSWGYKLYFRYILPWVGGLISGDRHAYTYLNRTVESFADQTAFLALLQKNGFRNTKAISLTFGIASLYYAQK